MRKTPEITNCLEFIWSWVFFCLPSDKEDRLGNIERSMSWAISWLSTSSHTYFHLTKSLYLVAQLFCSGCAKALFDSCTSWPSRRSCPAAARLSLSPDSSLMIYSFPLSRISSDLPSVLCWVSAAWSWSQPCRRGTGLSPWLQRSSHRTGMSCGRFRRGREGLSPLCWSR